MCPTFRDSLGFTGLRTVRFMAKFYNSEIIGDADPIYGGSLNGSMPRLSPVLFPPQGLTQIRLSP